MKWCAGTVLSAFLGERELLVDSCLLLLFFFNLPSVSVVEETVIILVSVSPCAVLVVPILLIYVYKLLGKARFYCEVESAVDIRNHLRHLMSLICCWVALCKMNLCISDDFCLLSVIIVLPIECREHLVMRDK